MLVLPLQVETHNLLSFQLAHYTLGSGRSKVVIEKYTTGYVQPTRLITNLIQFVFSKDENVEKEYHQVRKKWRILFIYFEFFYTFLKIKHQRVQFFVIFHQDNQDGQVVNRLPKPSKNLFIYFHGLTNLSIDLDK